MFALRVVHQSLSLSFLFVIRFIHHIFTREKDIIKIVNKIVNNEIVNK